MHPARLFVNRMLALLRSSTTRRVCLTEQFQRDIAWFNCFLYKFNGVVMIHKRAQPQVHVHVDASLSGIGAIWDGNVYAATYPADYLADKSIVHLEMCNVWVLVQMWGSYWKGKLVKVYCDNEAVVSVLATGRTRDDLLALCGLVHIPYLVVSWFGMGSSNQVCIS